MRIFLVEPYYGGSHRAWADGYAAVSRHDVSLVTHDAQFWKWRLHGAHLTLATEIAALDERPEVVLASSMMNVAGFLGAARETIGDAPVAVYFHESQFTYPLSPLDRHDETYPMINWSSAAVADLVLFNSEYHRHTFFEQVERFLRQFPDRRHSDLVAEVEERSTVLPVGIDAARFGASAEPAKTPLLLWNQRWEHDKGPDELVVMLEGLMALGLQFHVAVVGERFVSTPPALDRLPELLGDRLVEFGFLPDDDYAELLRRADVVVSTAHQEFFGVAVVEAMAAGAFPVLPDRLVYPERIPAEYRDRCLYCDADDLVDNVRWALEHREAAQAIAAKLAPAMAQFDWTVIAPRYDAALERLVSSSA
jgi:glycosyltransferase involved in cell wall biosynthesis